MKTLFVSFAALIFVFFVGCQSSITDPVEQESQNSSFTAEQENYTSKDAASVWPGTIKINGTLCDPVNNTCNTEINGVLKYKIIPVRAGNHPPTAYKVRLYINAKLKNAFTEPSGPWNVFGMSDDIVFLVNSNQGIYIFEKEFEVHNPMNWGYKLVLGFQVTPNDLKLVSMELKKSSAWEPIGDPRY